MSVEIICGDALSELRKLPAQSVHCCITSPPYWGLRDYGVEGQFGLEPTPELYVEHMVEVFREVRRVLRDDGTVWLNLGDSYASSGVYHEGAFAEMGANLAARGMRWSATGNGGKGRSPTPPGLKPKDLVGIPWRVAFALQADGWWLRSDIIWHKPNPMPESVRDRPTKAHEYLFLLSKSARYYYDQEAIKEPSTFHPADWNSDGTKKRESFARGIGNAKNPEPGKEPFRAIASTRNRRTVWTIATRPFKGAHFATFPPDLVEPCVKAGCPIGGTVLDPFFGAGTVGLVALQHRRHYIGIELNPEYVAMAQERLAVVEPVLL